MAADEARAGFAPDVTTALARGGETEQAESMYAPYRGRRTAVTTDLEHVRGALGADAWPGDLPGTPDRFKVSGLSSDAVAAAVKTYKSRASR